MKHGLAFLMIGIFCAPLCFPWEAFAVKGREDFRVDGGAYEVEGQLIEKPVGWIETSPGIFTPPTFGSERPGALEDPLGHTSSLSSLTHRPWYWYMKGSGWTDQEQAKDTGALHKGVASP